MHEVMVATVPSSSVSVTVAVIAASVFGLRTEMAPSTRNFSSKDSSVTTTVQV